MLSANLFIYIKNGVQQISRKISIFSSLFIESQVCPKCFRNFSPEIVLSKHISNCSGILQRFGGSEDEIVFDRSFYMDDYDDED